MTASQVTEIVNKSLGYDLGKWLDFSEISVIHLGRAGSFYVDGRTMRLKFNNAESMLEVKYGRYNSDGEFIDNRTNVKFKEWGNIEPDSYVSYAAIDGISRSALGHIQGSTYTHPFIN